MNDENGTAAAGAADVGTQKGPTGTEQRASSKLAQRALETPRRGADLFEQHMAPSKETKAKIFGIMTYKNAAILIVVALIIGAVVALAPGK
jgi:hypothetical protein